MAKKLMMMFAAVAAAFCAWAETETVGGYTWTYRINGDTAEIYKGSSSSAISPSPTGAMTIPSTLGGKTVTSIGSYAFYNCSGLTSVAIPDSVTSIGSSAFEGCSASIFDTATIPGVKLIDGWAVDHTASISPNLNLTGVRGVGDFAFSGCSGLTSVTIPDSVTSIGWGAFHDCGGMTAFTVGSGNPSYKSVSGLLLTKDGKTLVAGVNGDVTIPNGATSIGSGAFSGCWLLTSVTIPNGVTSIGSGAFSGCWMLTSVTIPDSVTSIGSYAFSGCIGLTSVTIPDSMTSIGSYAFYCCSGLTNVVIEAGVEEIGGWAFCACNNLVEVSIPDSMTSVGRRAFADCNEALYDTTTIPGLKLVDGWVIGFYDEFPSELDMKGVRGVADYALSGFSGVRNVTSLPQSVCLSRLYEVFPDSYLSITNVTIAEGVADIGSSAFYDCEGLMNVSIPDSVTNIGYHAFGSCTNLTSVTIPSKVETLRYTFEGCSSLKEVTLGASVSDIRAPVSCAFSGCTSLTKIDVAAENQDFKFAGGLLLTHDGKEVVYVPEGRDYVFIPESVVKIPWGAFSRCRKLAQTIDKYGIESIDGWIVGCDSDKLPKQLVLNGYCGIADDVFYGCEKLVSVVFGEEVTAIGNDSFSWCINLNSISVSVSVRKIDPEAFRCCFGLKNISVAKDNPTYKFENNLLLSKDDSELIAVSRNATSATIPEGVRYIPNGFFSGCMSLTDVKFPATVVDMFDEGTPFRSEDEYGHYWGCPALKSIVVADGNPVYKSDNGLLLANDDDEGWALAAVPQALTEITVPEGVKWIRYYAFAGCDKLSSLCLPSSIGGSDYEIYWDEYGWSPNLASIIVAVDNPWFSSANGLLLTKDGTEIRAVPPGVTNVTLPASVVDLGDGFYGCNKLKSIAVESGSERFSSINGMLVNSDGELVEVPRGLAGQTSIKIPVGVKRVGIWAFNDFGKLTSIDIPEGVAEIERYAFVGCESLSSVKLPSTLRVIGESAFSGCPIKSISFPEGLEEVGRGAFTELTRFDTTTVPGLRLIDGWMFGVSDTFEADYASPEDYLNDAINSSRIKGIAGGAFDRCNFLKKLVLPDCVKRIPCWMFGNCGRLERIELPGGLSSIGENAFVCCYGMGEVSIPASVRHVGVDAFSDNVINKDVVQGLGIVDGWVVRSYGTKAIVGDDESFVGELTLSGKDGIRGIADNAFCDSHGGCASDEREFSGVSNLVIGAGIVSIGERAFACCYDLTNVYLSTTVEFIGEYAFQGCDNLRTAFLPAMLKESIPQSVFPAKTKLLYCRDDGVIEYTVRFDSHGGVGRMENQTLVKDEAAELYGCAFTRTGYAFVGWTVSTTGGVVYGDGESVVNVYEKTGSDVVLYAVWKSIAAGMCEEVFDGFGVVAANDAWDTVVVITNDVSGTVEIPDNVGAVTIDLNGHNMVGDGGLGETALPGGPAIRIVKGDGDGGATQLAIVDTSEGEKGQISGGGESAGIEVAEDAATGVKLDVEEGVGVFNGDGSEQELKPKLVGTGKVTIPKSWKTGQKVTWKATADKGSVFARWEGPLVDSLNLTKNERRNPSLAFAVPEGFETNMVTAVFLPIDDDGLYSLGITQTEFELKEAVSDVRVTDDSQSYVTATASGLPTGLKFDAKKMTIAGTPTKSGVYWVQIKAKNASGYQWAENVRVAVSGGGTEAKEPKLTRTAHHPLTVICANEGGTASGTGVYAEGKKVSVKATPAKGYVFAGWHETANSEKGTVNGVDGADYRSASLNVTVPETRYVFALFATKEDDADSLKVAVEDVTTEKDGTIALDLGACVASLSLPKLAVSGLPTGLKYDTKSLKISGKATKPGVYTVTVKATNAAVTKATDASTATFKITVPNFECAALPGLKPETDAYGIVRSGVIFDDGLVDCTPADGWTVKVAGLPSGLKWDAKTGKIVGVPTAKAGSYTVKFTASKKGEPNQIATITLNVEALPDWVVGTFDGSVIVGGAPGDHALPCGLVAMTVAANGKISGKVIDADGTWALSAAAFDSVEGPVSNVEELVFHATVIGKSGKMAITNEVEIAAEEVAARPESAPYLRGAVTARSVIAPCQNLEPCVEWCAWQNLWKSEPWKTEAKAFAKARPVEIQVGGAHTSSDRLRGSLRSGDTGDRALPDGVVTLKFAATGAVTASGKFVTGQDASGRDIVYSASCSSVLIPDGDGVRISPEQSEHCEAMSLEACAPALPDALDFRVFLYFAPKAGKFDGFADEIPLIWDGAGFSPE